MPFPDLDPVLVQIGPFAIRWYALGYVAGILLGWRYVTHLVRNEKLWARRGPPATADQMDDLILWVTLGVILGGRLGYVLFYQTELFWTEPLEILKVWEGGMSFHGGALGVLIAAVLFARLNKIDLLRLGDLITASAPFGIFLVRIANFVNAELWGRPTDGPWGVVFCNDTIRANNGGVCPAGLVARHPSQLYEAALEGLVLFLVLLWATHSAKLLNRRGVVAGIFMLGYAVARIALENVREPDAYMPDFPLGLTMGMMLSLPMAIGGLFLIWHGMREPIPAQPTPLPEPARKAKGARADEPA